MSNSTSRTRKCLGCEGTGHVGLVGAIVTWKRISPLYEKGEVGYIADDRDPQGKGLVYVQPVSRWNGKRCAHVTRPERWVHPDHLVVQDTSGCDSCPACLGSGTVTDPDTRKDAMVDAETLRGTVEPALSGVVWDAFTAETQGLRVESLLNSGLYAHAYESARDAARFAFRAVPALKEA
jgi:hypothetical protein